MIIKRKNDRTENMAMSNANKIRSGLMKRYNLTKYIVIKRHTDIVIDKILSIIESRELVLSPVPRRKIIRSR